MTASVPTPLKSYHRSKIPAFYRRVGTAFVVAMLALTVVSLYEARTQHSADGSRLLLPVGNFTTGAYESVGFHFAVNETGAVTGSLSVVNFSSACFIPVSGNQSNARETCVYAPHTGLQPPDPLVGVAVIPTTNSTTTAPARPSVAPDSTTVAVHVALAVGYYALVVFTNSTGAFVNITQPFSLSFAFQWEGLWYDNNPYDGTYFTSTGLNGTCPDCVQY